MAKCSPGEIMARRARQVLIDAITARRNKCLETLKSMSIHAEYRTSYRTDDPVLEEIRTDGTVLCFNFRTFIGLNSILKKLENVDYLQNPLSLWAVEWSGSECYQIMKALFAYDCSGCEEILITHFCEMLDPHRYDKHE